MNFSAVIVAAGSSTRAGPGAPKPWRSLGGRPILRWSAEALAGAGAREIIVVTATERITDADEALAGLTGWSLLNLLCVTSSPMYGGNSITLSNPSMCVALLDPPTVHAIR